MAELSPQLLSDFLEWNPPPIKEIVKYLIPAGSVNFIYGDFHTWKSWIAKELALSVSNGTDWFGYPTTQSRVLLLNTELPAVIWQGRWKALTHARNIIVDGNLYVATTHEMKLDTSQGITMLRNVVVDLNIELIILDNLINAFWGDITRNTDSNGLINNCKQLTMDLGRTISNIHHARQGFIDNRGQRIKQGAFEMFGSSFLANWADTILEVKHEYVPRQPDTIRITPQKHRNSKFQPPDILTRFNRVSMRFEPVIKVETSKETS